MLLALLTYPILPDIICWLPYGDIFIEFIWFGLGVWNWFIWCWLCWFRFWLKFWLFEFCELLFCCCLCLNNGTVPLELTGLALADKLGDFQVGGVTGGDLISLDGLEFELLDPTLFKLPVDWEFNLLQPAMALFCPVGSGSSSKLTDFERYQTNKKGQSGNRKNLWRKTFQKIFKPSNQKKLPNFFTILSWLVSTLSIQIFIRIIASAIRITASLVTHTSFTVTLIIIILQHIAK